MKIGPVDPEIALLNLKKKKEINARKIYSPSGKFAERAKYAVFVMSYQTFTNQLCQLWSYSTKVHEFFK